MALDEGGRGRAVNLGMSKHRPVEFATRGKRINWSMEPVHRWTCKDYTSRSLKGGRGGNTPVPGGSVLGDGKAETL